MEETKYIWMDGKLIEWKDAKIHVLSHALHYGSGVFEGIRCYKTEKGTAIFRLQDHTKRLFNSAKAFRMKIPFSEDGINKATLQTVKENNLEAGYIRPIAFFGYGKMGLNPEGADVNVSIAVWPWTSYLGEEAIRVKVSSFIRTHPKTTDPNAKICGNYANSIFCSLEAKDKGFDEALVLDYKGNVAEGPGENLFIVKDGKIITVSLGNVLPGITRASIMQIAKNEGMEVEEKVLRADEVKDADEAFFTGTAAEVTAIASLDDKKIGNGEIGPITANLRKIYLDAVHGRIEKYEHWLSYV